MKGVVTSKPPGKKKPAQFPEQELYFTLIAMKAYGGSFAGHIAQATEVADSGNRAIMLDAFKHLFSKYGPGSDFYKAVTDTEVAVA
jgi:hypothetical protein